MVYIKEAKWNPLNIHFGEVEKGEHQKKISIKELSDKKELKIMLKARSYGIADFKGNKKYNMSLYSLNPVLVEKMIAFENYLVDYTVLNSASIFGKDLSKEILQYQFNGALKYQKDKNTKEPDYTKPFLSVKATNVRDQFTYNVFNEDRLEIFKTNNEGKTPIDLIPSRSEVKVALLCRGIWIGDGKWGLNWEIDQIQVFPVPEKPEDFLFDDSDEEMEEEEEEFLSSLSLEEN